MWLLETKSKLRMVNKACVLNNFIRIDALISDAQQMYWKTTVLSTWKIYICQSCWRQHCCHRNDHTIGSRPKVIIHHNTHVNSSNWCSRKMVNNPLLDQSSTSSWWLWLEKSGPLSSAINQGNRLWMTGSSTRNFFAFNIPNFKQIYDLTFRIAKWKGGKLET